MKQLLLSRQTAAVDVAELPDVETTNISLVLQNVQLERKPEQPARWMFSKGESPYVIKSPIDGGVFAYSHLSMNEEGLGNGSCDSGGSGRITRGYLDPVNDYLGLNDTNISSSRVVMNGLYLSNLTHYNVFSDAKPWDRLGESGDIRRYVNGTLEVYVGSQLILRATNLQMFQNITYSPPAGDAPKNSFYISGYFVGDLDIFNSNDKWVSRLDPHGTGYLLGLITAAAFGPRNCFAANSYWVTLRGFPDLGEGTTDSNVIYNNTASTGAKVGVYRGSNFSEIQTAKRLANLSVPVVTSVVSAVVVAAVSTAVVTSIVPVGAAALTVPGTGVSRLIQNAAFVARINEIHGFHTDVMIEFGDRLKPFLVKFPFPFSMGEESGSSRWLQFGSRRGNESEDVDPDDSVYLSMQVRQESEDEPSVTEELFAGCAFYTLLIVVGFLSLHLLIWIVLRKKPLEQQVAPHAWMVYLFSIVMSYVHTSSVLNSFQYLRSHVGQGTGKVGFYFVAVIQLVFIGLGFTVFSLTITILAVRRVRQRNVEWVPREKHPDPEVRGSILVVGEYQAEDSNVFHSVFESYYSALSGPRVWVVGVELTVTFLDTLFTALIWDEIICLAVLLSIHASLVLVFLTLNPFVDTIEGRLVSAIGVVDLILLFLEFVGALGDYDTAERMESAAVLIGFISIALGVLISFYCDVIPMTITVWGWLKKQIWCFGRSYSESEESVWSLLSLEEIGEEIERSKILQGCDSDEVAETIVHSEKTSISMTRSRTRSKYLTALRPVERENQPWVAPYPVGQDMTIGSARGHGHKVAEEDPQQGDPSIDWEAQGQVIYTVWSTDLNGAGSSGEADDMMDVGNGRCEHDEGDGEYACDDEAINNGGARQLEKN